MSYSAETSFKLVFVVLVIDNLLEVYKEGGFRVATIMIHFDARTLFCGPLPLLTTYQYTTYERGYENCATLWMIH
jgi:hypothetical protein